MKGIKIVDTKEKADAVRSQFRATFLERVKAVLGGDADHFWMPLGRFLAPGLWVTGEAAREQKDDGSPDVYVCCYLTDRVDSLGYCNGTIFLDGYPDAEATDEQIEKYADWFLDNLNEARSEVMA